MRTLITSALLIAIALSSTWGAENTDYLTDAEVDKLRDAQEPSERIAAYLEFAQVRLERFDDYRERPVNPDYDVAGYLDTQLDQYIHITDALKDWIEDRYNHRIDMRAGLRKFLETGPHAIDQLQRIEHSSDPYSAGYHQALLDAIDDFTDALDGATKALSDQTKQFGELKREDKATEQTTKENEKEEKKRARDESKLRKKGHEQGPPTDKDED
jgi:hypothetical protein